MRPVIPAYLDVIRGSHQMIARARVIPPGLTGTNPGPLTAAGEPVNAVSIVAGDVQLDSTAQIRSTLDLTTSDPFPDSPSDLLTPYGNELFVERGALLGDGTRVWVSLGYFRIDDLEQDQAPDGDIQISASDRMAGIVDANREQPIQFPAGASVEGVFTQLVTEVYPDAVIEFDFDAANTLFTSSHALDEDRYQFLKDIVDSLGKVMYYDYAGVLQVRSDPDTSTPVFTVDHGSRGVLMKLARSLSRKDTFNAVVAVGQQVGEAPPARAVAYDDDPSSPTFWDGPFGKVPVKLESTFIETNEQAYTAAYAKLSRSLGVPYSVDFTAIPNAALEPLDPITVSYQDHRASEVHVIEKLGIPLTSDQPMTGQTRQRVFGGTA